MGIDIYAKWKGQTKEDKEKQYTGFSVVLGNIGYLREAYHGGPYVTHYFVDEAFEKGSAKIHASVLRERLPNAVILAMIRNNKLYANDEDKTEQTFDSLYFAIKNIFSVEVNDKSHEEFIAKITPELVEQTQKLIDARGLPDYAMSFVEFVELCEKKEKETGEPCEIIASY